MRQSMKSPNGASHIKAAMAKLKMNGGDMAAALGVSYTSLSRWLGSNESPAWTDLAIECLWRRANKHVAGSTVMVIKVNKTQADALGPIFKALGVPASAITTL
jgi:hypothetical protein